MVTNSFNVSSKDDETQKNARAEEERVQKIENIKDTPNKRKAHTMLNTRDHDLGIMRAGNKEKRERIIDEQEKKISPNAQMHLRPKNAPAESVEARQKHIRKTVETSVGKEHKKQEDGFYKSQNSEIDSFVSTTLKNERSQQRKASDQTRSEFSQNASDVTKRTAKDTINRSAKGRGGTSR